MVENIKDYRSAGEDPRRNPSSQPTLMELQNIILSTAIRLLYIYIHTQVNIYICLLYFHVIYIQITINAIPNKEDRRL